jgi:hypothetical protein
MLLADGGLSAVKLNAATHPWEVILKIFCRNDQYHFDLGIKPKEDGFGDFRYQWGFFHMYDRETGSFSSFGDK